MDLAKAYRLVSMGGGGLLNFWTSCRYQTHRYCDEDFWMRPEVCFRKLPIGTSDLPILLRTLPGYNSKALPVLSTRSLEALQPQFAPVVSQICGCQTRDNDSHLVLWHPVFHSGPQGSPQAGEKGLLLSNSCSNTTGIERLMAFPILMGKSPTSRLPCHAHISSHPPLPITPRVLPYRFLL